MNRIRIIPILLIKGEDLVKGSTFQNHKYIGDPINTAKIFCDMGADEICILDIEATIKKRKPNYDLLNQIAKQTVIPLSYGGAINSLSRAERLFNLGFEKCIINTSAYYDINLIKEISSKYGSQSLTISIDYFIEKNTNKILLYSHSNSISQNISLLDHAKNVQSAGCGEIIITNISKEGNYSKLDASTYLDLISQLDVPVILSGGAESYDEIFSLSKKIKVSAFGVGSLFSFYNANNSVLINYPSKKDIEKFI